MATDNLDEDPTEDDDDDDVLVGGTRIGCCHEDAGDGDEDMIVLGEYALEQS